MYKNLSEIEKACTYSIAVRSRHTRTSLKFEKEEIWNGIAIFFYKHLAKN
jgi:hypothetical protein